MSDVQVDVESGIWHCEREAHTFDEPLADVLAKFLLDEKAESVMDVGCGSGDYVRHLRKAGLQIWGVDGNPKTAEFCEGCETADILGDRRWVSDWVLCLEVGEHIPPKYETQFIQVITEGARTGIVLSWFPMEGHGIGHFNPKPNEYVKSQMAERGFKSDEEAQEKLRKAATLWWFSLSLMVFRRNGYVLSEATVPEPIQPFYPEEYSGRWSQ